MSQVYKKKFNFVRKFKKKYDVPVHLPNPVPICSIDPFEFSCVNSALFSPTLLMNKMIP